MNSLRPKTIAEIREELSSANKEEFEALKRALAADDRKGVHTLLSSAQKRIDAEAAEAARLDGMYAFQDEIAHGGTVVGLDEVGRGPVAGPLTVGAVVLSPQPRIANLNDSKQLSPSVRESVAAAVKETAVAWHIEHVSPADIDDNGMAWALKTAFSRALAAIEAQGIKPDVVLIDGNPLHIDPREVNVVKGDAKCASIAAASVIAKVERDALMEEMGKKYPGYAFEKSKGYASPEHIAAIKDHGLTPIHRATFCTSFIQESLF